jgi:putative acetyltransferase
MTNTIALQYRRMLLRDLVEVQRLGRATYVPYYTHIWKPGGAEWYLDKCFGHQTLTAELADPAIEYWVPQTTAGEPVGLVKLVPQRPTPDGASTDAFYLEKIYLLPAFHQKGYGQIVLQWIANRAQALGRSVIWLQAHQNGPVKAYERAGFAIAEPARFEYALIHEAQRAAWTMIRPVDPTELPVRIAPFSAERAIYFRDLNLAWIERFFRIEPHDLEQLEAPETEIIAPGGQILFATVGNQVVGTVALVKDADSDGYELAKMAVDPAFQGRQLGRQLGEAALSAAREQGARRVWLESNRQLTTALNLYGSLGFQEIPLADTPYARADIKMAINL